MRKMKLILVGWGGVGRDPPPLLVEGNGTPTNEEKSKWWTHEPMNLNELLCLSATFVVMILVT
jgi:hypothetical protein